MAFAKALARMTDPRLVVVPLTASTFALASLALHLGRPGIVGGAVVGALWSLLLAFVAVRLTRRAEWAPYAANAPVLLSVAAGGLLVGGGLMYGLLMKAALTEPSTTWATLSALMQPTIPYFIVVNTSLETVLVPLVVLCNWHLPRRRPFVLLAAVCYFAMRAWTYLTFAPRRVEIAARPLSPDDVAWFQHTMAGDYRGWLNVATFVLLMLAALAPPTRPGPATRAAA
jgi:hypothetical protein